MLTRKDESAGRFSPNRKRKGELRSYARMSERRPKLAAITPTYNENWRPLNHQIRHLVVNWGLSGPVQFQLGQSITDLDLIMTISPPGTGKHKINLFSSEMIGKKQGFRGGLCQIALAVVSLTAGALTESLSLT